MGFMNTPASVQMFELDGYTLSAFRVADNEQLHPGLWEIHPAGDEVLLMCSGAVDVVMRHGDLDALSVIGAGRGLVVPAGVPHRLSLREPGLLIALTRRPGTRLSATP